MAIAKGNLVRLKCPEGPVMVMGKFCTSAGSEKYEGMYQCFWWSSRDEEFRSEWFFPEMLEEVEVTDEANGMGGSVRKITPKK